MKWIRFTLDTHTDVVDILSYMLDEIGVEGIEIEDNLPLSEEDKKKMFVDILPDPVDTDGSAKVHFYMEPENCDPEKVMLQVQDVLQEAKQVQETLLNNAKECQNSVVEYRKQIGILEARAQQYQKQSAVMNDIINLFIQTR